MYGCFLDAKSMMTGNRSITFLQILSVILFAFICPNAYAMETLVWMISDYPPVGIAKGRHAGQGMGDQILRIIMPEMPGLNHRIERSNLKRMLADLETGKNVCVPGLIRTPEREKFMHYTKTPIMILTPLSLVIRKKDRHLYGKEGTVSLEEIILNKKLKLGLPEGISGDSKIDRIINMHRNEPHIYFDSSGGLISSILLMVSKGRIDYTIAYPWMVKYMSDEMGLTDDLVSLKMKESSSSIIYYVACARNAWGVARIREIDNVLGRVRSRREYRQAMEAWMPKETLPEYRQQYDRVFLRMK
jgi:uncharacterized protein (TIGR02285 family)